MKWTLRTKILLGYGIALALMVVILAWSYANLRGLGRASNAILTENYNSILAAENMINAIERQDSAILLLILRYQDEGLRQFAENESQFLQWLARAKDNITIEGEAEIVAAIDSGYGAYLGRFSRLSLSLRTEPADVNTLYHETVLPSFKSVRDACIHLREINQKTMFEASEHARYVATRAIVSMLTLGMVAIGVGLAFSLLLSALLTKPLSRIIAATHKIAEGDYDVEVGRASSDELGRLATDFNLMTRKLRAYRDLNVQEIVSEKQKSEAIIRSVDDGLVVVDTDFKVADINPAATAIFERRRLDVVGKHFLELVSNEELLGDMRQVCESGRTPSVPEAGENLLSIERGSQQRHYQFSITPVKSADAGVIGVVLVLRDVTRLKELDRLKSEFVMAASHELRTPLTSMSMSVELLRENAAGKLNDNERQLLEAAHEEMQRLRALVNDLLDISKIEAGKMDMAFDRTPVAMLLEKAVAMLKNQADEKSIELSFKIAEDLPDVKVDANKIAWVLTNLISNAMRYTDTGGSIRLSAEAIGPQIQVSVTDSGAGIPYEYQSRIFDKFVQVKTDKSVGGTGLGLAICKEIVRAHGGTIWVDSVPGQGSTFTFTIPVVEWAGNERTRR